MKNLAPANIFYFYSQSKFHFKMKNFQCLLAICCLIVSVSFAQEAPQISKEPLVIGETLSFRSDVLGEDRVLNIYLPLNYTADSLRNYPVIYLLDGSIDEDFQHVSGLVQFGSFAWINWVPESIVVGIANVNRQRDFTFPTTIEQDKVSFPATGGSANFISFLDQEVKPLIQDTYRTDSVSTLIGQSLGGLLATEILFSKPELFDNYVIVSPSLWWDAESLLSKSLSVNLSTKSVAIAVGQEGKIMEHDAKALYKKIDRLSQGPDKLNFHYYKRLNHGDALHLAAYDALEFIFGQKE